MQDSASMESDFAVDYWNDIDDVLEAAGDELERTNLSSEISSFIYNSREEMRVSADRLRDGVIDVYEGVPVDILANLGIRPLGSERWPDILSRQTKVLKVGRDNGRTEFYAVGEDFDIEQYLG